MRTWWWLALLSGCGAPASAPVDAPPPAVDVGGTNTVVMEPAIRRAPEAEPALKAGQLRRNGDGPVPVYGDDPIRGDDLAPVTVVLFTDYQCPPCAMATPVVADVQAELGDATVRLVHKHFPIKHHPVARPAAEVAVAVHQLGGMKAFDAFERILLDRQASLTEEAVVLWAAEVGIAEGKLVAFLAKPTAAAKVDRDIALAQALDVAGVPDVVINGKRLDDALQAPALRAAIEAEVALVKQLRREGTPADATYRVRCEANVGGD